MQTGQPNRQVGCLPHTIPRIASCHPERSRGIWPRSSDTQCPPPDVSTALRFARHDKRDRRAFTLIELLVVISIIALLMAILLPTLQRVKKQARAVVCQARLRQWGLAIESYTQENDGKFWYHSNPVWRAPSPAAPEPEGVFWWNVLGPYYGGDQAIFLCPMAARRFGNDSEWYYGIRCGATFMPWFAKSWGPLPGPYPCGSYGMNVKLNQVRCLSPIPAAHAVATEASRIAWKTCLVQGASSVPVSLDCVYWDCGYVFEDTQPPPAQEIPAHEQANPPAVGIQVNCIDRHDGGGNGLFLDWSVRKVGVKELWTLKWHREYNTAGKWTKAGGVRPEDWPAWMRKFKDY